MFTMRKLGDAVLAAMQRGVQVRIIIDKSMISTSGSQINNLQLKGKLNTISCHTFQI